VLTETEVDPAAVWATNCTPGASASPRKHLRPLLTRSDYTNLEEARKALRQVRRTSGPIVVAFDGLEGA
jgi:hypothetical protein